MATANVIVVSINYRLAPERAFPSQLIDAKRALGWVKRNIRDYGGNPSAIIVGGESAGGHLSAMMNLTINDEHFQPSEDVNVDTSVIGCVDLYGVHDLSIGMIKVLSKRVLLQDNESDYFEMGSPTPIVNAMINNTSLDKPIDPPPMLIIHGTRDVLASLKGAKVFHEQLIKLRNTNRSTKKDVFVVQPAAHHAFGYLKSPRTISTALAIADFMKSCTNVSRL